MAHEDGSLLLLLIERIRIAKLLSKRIQFGSRSGATAPRKNIPSNILFCFLRVYYVTYGTYIRYGTVHTYGTVRYIHTVRYTFSFLHFLCQYSPDLCVLDVHAKRRGLLPSQVKIGKDDNGGAQTIDKAADRDTNGGTADTPPPPVKRLVNLKVGMILFSWGCLYERRSGYDFMKFEYRAVHKLKIGQNKFFLKI